MVLAWRAGREDREGGDNYVYAPLGEFERVFQTLEAREVAKRSIQFGATETFMNVIYGSIEPYAVQELTSPTGKNFLVETAGSEHIESQKRMCGSKRKSVVDDRSSKVFRTVQQSRKFTDRLEALADGATVNMLIGDSADNLTTLRSALRGVGALSLERNGL